jgi:ribosomal protein L29
MEDKTYRELRKMTPEQLTELIDEYLTPIFPNESRTGRTKNEEKHCTD